MINNIANSKLALVLTTEADSERATSLANALLQARLVACVSFLDVQSHYKWKGKIEKAEEVQLLIKTTRNNLKAVIKAIEELHSYENPELIFWDVCSGKFYGDWATGVIKSCDA